MISTHTNAGQHWKLGLRARMSNSLWPHALQPARRLFHGDSLGKIIGEGCHALLQGNLPNPRTKPVSPALAGWFFSTESPGKPWNLNNSQEIRRSTGVFSTITNSFISFRNRSPKRKRLPSHRTCLIYVAPALALGQPQKVLYPPSSSLKYSPYQRAPHTLNSW